MHATSPDWLHYQAQVHPQKLALVSKDRQWTFDDLDTDVAHLAGLLSTMDLHAGDRVAYRLASSAEQVLLVHALTRLHLVLVPLNTRLTPKELEPIIDNAEPSLIIEDASQEGLQSSIPRLQLPSLIGAMGSESVIDTTLSLEDLHALVYTSGTTGIPKGVELTVGNQWWSAMSFALNAGIQVNDRWHNVMPLFHVGGLTILFRSVIHGSTVVLAPRFDSEEIAQQLNQWNITLVSWVPTMLHRMLERDYIPSEHLRLILLGGAPAASDLLQRARSRGYPVVPTYGMTETCSQIVTLPHSPLHERMGSSGHPNLPTLIRIGDPFIPEPPGRPGEILVSGPSVARGYHRHPKATQETFREGWLHTGDMGYQDHDGYLYVIDRMKDLIICGGENVFPTEVESHLLAAPGIRDAAVFSRPDHEWGERVAAALVIDSLHPPQRAALQEFLSNRLASYKMPSIYFVLTEIPRNASGKILRALLQEQTATASEW